MLLHRLSLPCEFTAKPQRRTCSMASGRFLEPQSYKVRIKDKFRERAATYDDNDTLHPKIAQLVLKHAPLRPGNAVLDVATGTGLVALEVINIVGPTGKCLGIDISDAMVEQAVAKAGQLKATNVEFIVADVEDYTFPDGSFDAILSSSAIPYLQHIPRTFERFHAWLRKGGRLVFNTPESVEYGASFALTTLYQLVMERYPDVRLVDAAAETGVPDRLERALYGAGFSTVEIFKEPNQIVFRDMAAPAFAERMWTQWTTFPMNPLHLALSTEQIEALHGPYMQEATKQGEAAQVGSDIVVNFTELIVVATA